MSGDEREDYGAIVVVPDGIPIRLGRAFESTDLNDYQKLKAFCLKWRIKIHQCETLSQEIIWENFEWAIWRAMRRIGGANMPCYPAKNHKARLQALDSVIDWCEQTPEPAQAAPVDPQKEIRALPEDGLCSSSRVLTWGGVRYSLTPNQMKVVKVLHENYSKGKPDVGLAELKNKCDSAALNESFAKVFQIKRKGKKSYNPVLDVIDSSSQGTYRLKDPKII